MADTDGVEVKLGADTADATRGMDAASSSIQSSLNAINQTLQNFGNKNTSTVREAIANNANLSRSFMELKGSATGGFNAIAGVIERFRGVLGTLAAALAGGALFKGSVEAMLRMEDAVRGLEIVFGVTAAKATEMAVTLRLAGVEAGTFEMMAMRVGMRLRINAAEFDTLGIKTRDSTGALLPMEQIMKNIYARMQEFKAGADQDLFALTAVGRNARDFAGDMQRMELAAAMTTEVMKRLGIEMGPDRQSQIERYRMSVNEFKLTIETMGEKIGEALLPRLQGLAEWFNSYGPSSIEVIKFAMSSLITVFTYLGTFIGNMVVFAVSRFQNMATAAVSAWQVVKAAATGNFGAIPGIIAEANARIVANTQAATDTIANQWAEAKKKFDAAWGGNAAPTGLPSAVPKSGNARMPDLHKGTEDTGWMDNELKAQQNLYNNEMMAQGSFQTWSEEQTRDYWEEILSMSTLSAKERQEAENHYYDAERAAQQKNFAQIIAALHAELAEYKNNAAAKIGILESVYKLEVDRYGATSVQAQAAYKEILKARQEEADKVKKIAEEQANNEIKLAKLQIAGQDQNLKQMVALRQISTQQELEAEKNLENQLYALEQQGFRQREALAEGDQVELTKIYGEEALAYQTYQNKLTAIDQAAEKDRQQNAITAANDIQSAFAEAFDQIAMNTKKLSDVFKQMVTTITSDLTKLAANDVAKQLFGAGTTGGNALTGLMSKIFGGGAAGASSPQVVAETANTTALAALTTALAANTAAITSSALGGLGGGLGGGGGGGGVSSIFSDVAGMTDMVGFESGTPYVPQTSLAIVHRGERIVPASQNQSYAFGGTRNNFMINGPIDTRTMAQISRQSAKAANRARRQG